MRCDQRESKGRSGVNGECDNETVTVWWNGIM